MYSIGEDYEEYLHADCFFRDPEYKSTSHKVETVNIDIMPEQLAQ